MFYLGKILHCEVLESMIGLTHVFQNDTFLFPWVNLLVPVQYTLLPSASCQYKHQPIVMPIIASLYYNLKIKILPSVLLLSLVSNSLQIMTIQNVLMEKANNLHDQR